MRLPGRSWSMSAGGMSGAGTALDWMLPFGTHSASFEPEQPQNACANQSEAPRLGDAGGHERRARVSRRLQACRDRNRSRLIVVEPICPAPSGYSPIAGSAVSLCICTRGVSAAGAGRPRYDLQNGSEVSRAAALRHSRARTGAFLYRPEMASAPLSDISRKLSRDRCSVGSSRSHPVSSAT